MPARSFKPRLAAADERAVADTTTVDKPTAPEGRLFRSRRERVVAGIVFAVLTAVALGGRPLVEALIG